MANKKISELPYINVTKISGNTLVPLVTYFSASTGDTVHTYIDDIQTYLISGLTGNTDVFVTGGTYSAGTITPTPGLTQTPTLTNTPTLTPTPTTSGCNHLYYLPFGFRTNVTGDFSTSFLSACTAFNCVTGGTCGVNAANLVYLDQSEPQIGSNIYFNIDDCFAGPLNGYFLVKIGGSHMDYLF
jgi:hypothetical protein